MAHNPQIHEYDTERTISRAQRADGETRRALWLEYFTHWRPVIELPMPIY